MNAAGVLVGLGVGVGGWVAVAATPVRRRPRIGPRLDPYLARRRPQPVAVTPFVTIERLVRPVVADLAVALDRRLGGRDALAARLARAGGGTVEEFRVSQVVWGVVGLGAATALLLLAVARGKAVPLPVLALGCAAGALAGVVARDQALARAVALRERRLTEEFPAVADLLAFAVAAGDSVAGALDRVVRVTSGELAGELAIALSDVRVGRTLDAALRGVAERTGLALLTRFVDGMVAAQQRGTPMAEVLRGQAADVRAAAQRELMEAAGRKDIAMLVPVVFLVLPAVVVVALFPGFYGLVLTIP